MSDNATATTPTVGDVQQRWRFAVWTVAGAFVLVEVLANVFAVVLTRVDGIEGQVVDAIGPGGETLLQYMELEMHVDALIFLSALIVGALILSRYPNHGFGWALGVGWGVLLTTMHAAMVITVASVVVDAWNPLTPYALWVQSLDQILFPITIPLALMVYPTGHMLGPWFRRVTYWAFAVVGVIGIGLAFRDGPIYSEIDGILVDNPFGIWVWSPVVAFELLSVVTILIMIVTLVARYRRAEGVERLQMKWVFLIAGGALILLAASGFVESSYPDAANAMSIIAGAFAAVGVLAIGAAILRYRLFDIDVVISRSIVFGLLAVFITVVYAVVVGTLGSVIAGSDVVLAIVATTIVAVLFEPVRDRVQRLANRLVYGSRAAPYEVLSDLTRSLPNAEEEAGLLDRMATQLRAGTGAERAQVWLATDDGVVLAASDPAVTDTHIEEFDDLDGVVIPIEHDGGTLGALTVEPAAGASLRPAELRLAEDLAGSAALVVTKLRLDTDLERTAAELASSRRRLVDAQDTELRRLERQLQEGAIQDIVGLKVAITLAARTAHDEGTDRTAGLLTGLATEAQGAIDQIHSLAAGLYPALLESEGLESAIGAMAATAPVPITVTGSTQRLDRDTEIAAFYTITEAVTNAIKHANPPITITLDHTAGLLTFTITDTGPGFDPTTNRNGSGLLNMTDRLDTIGGTLTITTTPGTPTTITGVVPTHVGETPVAGAVPIDSPSAYSAPAVVGTASGGDQ